MRLLTWLPHDIKQQLKALDPASGAVLTSSPSLDESLLPSVHGGDGVGLDTTVYFPGGSRHRRGLRRTLWPAVVAAMVVLAVALIPILAARHRAGPSTTAALGSTEFVAVTPPRAGTSVYSVATGQSIRQLANTNNLVGITGDRRQALVEAAGPPNVCGGGGADFQLISIDSGATTSAFTPSEHVISAAVGGDALVGVVTATSRANQNEPGSCRFPAVSHAQIVVKSLTGSTQRILTLRSELGRSPNQVKLMAVSPDGRWAVLEDHSHAAEHAADSLFDSWQLIDLLSSPTDPLARTLYDATAPIGGGRIDKWAIAHPADCTTVTGANLQFTPTNNRLQVDFVCDNQMTLIDYDPATLSMVSTKNLTSPPGFTHVDLFSMHWNQSGSEALVRIDQHAPPAYSSDSRLYLYRNQQFDLITDTVVYSFFW